MIKKTTILSILIGMILIGVTVGYFTSVSSLVKAGSFTDKTCVASTTVWNVGADVATTVLPDRNSRGSFILVNASSTALSPTVYYRLENTAASLENAVNFLTASSSVTFDEDFPVRGVVSAITDAGTSTLSVTECVYNL